MLAPGMDTSVPAFAPRILVVEDHDDSRASLRELLQECGYVVDEACNGQVALDVLLATPDPALVILDLEMPVLSGTELIEIMKANERLANVPVLVVSGSSPRIIPKAEAIVGFVPKPFDWERLLATVRGCVGAGQPA
jgi:CheY-like chemotaxis protein